VDGAEPREAHVERPGVTLAYRSYGEGPPVVLLSGGPGIASGYFDPVAEKLAAHFHVIVLDQRGTGRSVLPRIDAETIQFDLYVDDLEALRADLGADQLTLLGHSWGGVLAMGYAARHPDRVRALVLVGSGGPTTAYLRWDQANILCRLTADEKAALLFWQDPGRFVADPARAVIEMSRITASAMTFERASVHALVAQTATPEAFNAEITLAMQPFLAQGYDFRPALAESRFPTLIVQGRQDPVGDATAREIHSALPNATIRFIEECGHWPFVEQAEEFFETVEPFLLDELPRN